MIYSLSDPTPARSEESEDDVYLLELLKKAEEDQLHNDRYWKILLHYKPTRFGFKSLIDDPIFFLSDYGKEDPKEELKATIVAFFRSDKEGDEHPKCRFIARYEWLKEKLNIDKSALSNIACSKFNDIVNNTMQPKSATLVFPSVYMNNPASMFGHTLIRIDSSYQSKLLSYAANYAAFVEDKLGFFYAFKGIFGYYKGYFKVFPYYERVREYNDTEQRDIWEYDLNLSEEEVRRMLAHLWELKDIYSYYYFFDENCSYNLLFLLEAARPSLHLTDRLEPWVIPVDTIRAINDSGIVESMEFRPAKATRIRYIASLLDRNSQITALKIVDKKLDPGHISNIESDEKIDVLNLAIEAIQYRYNNKELTRDEYLKLFLSALRERSELGNPDDNPYIFPIPPPPESGHFSSRFSLAIGIKENKSFQEVRYRPAYHSLTDPDEGYLEGSQIVFGDTAIRHTDERIRLENLDLIDIASLSPRDRFFKPISFKIKTGVAQKLLKDKDEHLVYQLNPGLGVAYKNELIGLYYALPEANLYISGELKNNYALGIGVLVGTIKKITGFWKINISGEALAYGLGERFQEYRASTDQIFKLSQNNSLNLSISLSNVFNNGQSEVKLDWNYYF